MTSDRRSCSSCGGTFPATTPLCALDGSVLLEGKSDALIGREIDRYKITECIQDGGMARLYRAEHQFLEKDFAIKVLFGELCTREDVADRFHREALAASRVRHPNVVHIVDFGKTKEGLLFMAMDFVHGPTLAERLKESPRPSRDWVLKIMAQLADGLSAVHKLGFVHRDLKPANVMLQNHEGEDTVRLLDFGLVNIDESPLVKKRKRLTMAGSFLGTPTYMAPEQIVGEPVTPQTDLYALGVMLYEMLHGAPPFVGSKSEVLTAHVTRTPGALDTDEALQSVVLALVAKDAVDRPKDAESVAKQLRALVERPPAIVKTPLPEQNATDGEIERLRADSQLTRELSALVVARTIHPLKLAALAALSALVVILAAAWVARTHPTLTRTASPLPQSAQKIKAQPAPSDAASLPPLTEADDPRLED